MCGFLVPFSFVLGGAFGFFGVKQPRMKLVRAGLRRLGGWWTESASANGGGSSKARCGLELGFGGCVLVVVCGMRVDDVVSSFSRCANKSRVIRFGKRKKKKTSDSATLTPSLEKLPLSDFVSFFLLLRLPLHVFCWGVPV